MGAEQDLQNVPGVASNPEPDTKDFIFQQVCIHTLSLYFAVSINYTVHCLMIMHPVQTMYRIKDPKRSLDFYTRIIGMR